MKRNLILLSLYKALQMSLFPLAVITVFLQFQIGLTPADILMLQSIKSTVSAICEFPSGWIADRIGYKKTLLIGAFCLTICWSLYSTASSFSHVLVADIFLGLGWSFIYGTDSAMLYESLANIDRTHELTFWSGRITFWGQLSEGICALFAGWLYSINPQMPFKVQLYISLLTLVIALFLIEPKRQRSIRKDWGKEVIDMFKLTFVKSPTLRYATLLFIILGIASYLQVWNIQLFAKENGISPFGLGINWAIANLFVAFGSLFSHRLERSLGLIKTLWLCLALIFVGYLGLYALPGVIGFTFYYFLTFERGINHPVLNTLKQGLIKSENRAAMLSITNFSFRIIFAVICPFAGWLILNYGFQNFFGIIGSIFLSLGFILILKLKKQLHNKSPN